MLAMLVLITDLARAMTRLSRQIREAIASSGLTRYRIAEEAGVAQSTLSRFMAGEGGLTLDTLDRIAEVLRLSLVCKGPTQRTLRSARGRGRPPAGRK